MEIPPDFKIHFGLQELESKIGVRESFFQDLLNEDDWSFIIKLHALFEAACTHLLLFHFKEPTLSGIFSRLELSNKTTGKVAFLEKLELIGKDNRKLVSALSELRNTLVHDVRNAEFSLSTMIMSFSPSEIKQFAVVFSPYETLIRKVPFSPELNLGFPEDVQAHASIERMIERLRNNPKLHIWVGAHRVLSSITEMYGYSDYMQWVKAKEILDSDDAP